MRTREELKHFFNVTLSPNLTELEKQRLKILHSALIAEAVALVIILALFFYLGSSTGILVFGALLMSVLFLFFTHRFRSPFKQVVIAPLVEFFDESLRYSPDNKIPQYIYEKSKLFLQRVDKYQGDDLVQGKIGITQINFSELHTQYKTETRDSKGHRRTQWHTIFKGLFFVADFNKHFNGRTIVLPDTAEKLFGGLGQFLQSKNMSRDELVKMDDPEFEKEFVVYATDQIEARYILSPSLMSRIMNFRRKTGNKLCLSFVDSTVFIAISYTKNLFEPNIFKTLFDFSPIEEYFNDLSTALSIVDELNLNTRIWSKV